MLLEYLQHIWHACVVLDDMHCALPEEVGSNLPKVESTDSVFGCIVTVRGYLNAVTKSTVKIGHS